MVQAAALARVKLRVIGKPYHPTDPYYLLFLQALQDARPWVEYLGSIEDRAQLAEEYRKAAGFVLLSAMESQSLSALEAAACGCPLLLSDLPWARSSFGGEASYAPIAPNKITAGLLRRFTEGIADAPKVSRVPSWDDVGGRLAQIYNEAMTSR
jgi:glycosyltransferase involved in cell wall biosynthesis